MPDVALKQTWPQRLPFYYGWIMVAVAAAAMTATFPGRTHGVALFTQKLLKDLQLSESQFAVLNLWGSLIGAGLCLPVGIMIDRWGVRLMLLLVTGGLGLSVLSMKFATGPTSLLIVLILTRAFGQSALSVVSMALVGKWFRRRLGPAMGLLTLFLTIGFIGSILGMEELLKHRDWRQAWYGMAWGLFAFGILGWLITRDSPEACGLPPDDLLSSDAGSPVDRQRNYSLREALQTPAFWVFVAGTSAFNLVYSGAMLFNESILLSRGFSEKNAQDMNGIVLATMVGAGLLANIVAGALAQRSRLGILLGIGLAIMASGMGIFPLVTTPAHVYWYGAAMGISGGFIMVVYFSVWRLLYGLEHLGRIKGTAQFCSVLASALGPVLFTTSLDLTGSYTAMFHATAVGLGVLAVLSLIVPLPSGAAQPVPT